MRVLLPDGSEREFPAGTTPAQAVAALGEPGRELLAEAVAARLDGRVVGLNDPLERGGRLSLLTFADAEGREVYRHTAAHVLAQAVKRLFPEARLAVGPPTEDGFYYDIETPRPLSPEDLEAIEAEMGRIVAADLPVERQALARAEAERLFAERGEHYKVEIIGQIPPDDAITVYRQAGLRQ